MNLTEVQERLCVEDEGKWDTRLKPEEMELEDGKLALSPFSTVEVSGPLTLSSWATTQLCQRLSMPTAYFKRCPPHLQDVQANFWLRALSNGKRRGEEKWLLRAKGTTARAILSDRYTPLDHRPLVNLLAPLVETRLEVRWFALSDESLHLRVIDPTLAREALPGDRLVAGLHIANSEVGKRAVTVDALVWRLVCQNGLLRLVKGRSLLYQRHIALSQPRFGLALERAVHEALLQGMGFLERMLWATQETLPDVDKTLKTLSERWHLSEEMQSQVRRALLSERHGQQETLYGLVNAVTSAAQTLNADDRYDLEALAGQLLERGMGLNGHAPLPALPAPSHHEEGLFAL